MYYKRPLVQFRVSFRFVFRKLFHLASGNSHLQNKGIWVWGCPSTPLSDPSWGRTAADYVRTCSSERQAETKREGRGRERERAREGERRREREKDGERERRRE